MLRFSAHDIVAAVLSELTGTPFVDRTPTKGSVSTCAFVCAYALVTEERDNTATLALLWGTAYLRVIRGELV